VSDYHLHLFQHGPYDGTGPPPGEYPDGFIESYVEAAAARGVAELGFTEHLFRCVESADVLGAFWEGEPKRDLSEQAAAFVTEDRVLSLDGYVDAVLAAKDAGLPVLLGLEVDFFPDTIDAVLRLLAPYPWDFLIGSVHWIGGWSVDHPDVAFEFERRGVDQSYAHYFELETALASSGAVDVLAHVDVVKKFGHRPTSAPDAYYARVAAAAAASGTAVELNSNGLNSVANEIYPSPAFLAELFAAGVPITFASDGHRPQDAARGHDEVVAAARAAGYENRLRFAERVATSVGL
jgi:histidinol-phosphatase (PHP family)